MTSLPEFGASGLATPADLAKAGCMTTVAASRAVPPAVGAAPRGLRRPGWPLFALYVLFPLWWVLGLSHFIFLVLSVPMAWELMRRRPVFAPTGFGVWLLFLVVVASGSLLLWVVPPGTVPVEGTGKLLAWSYHFAWYVAVTIVALYIVNMPERELPTEKVMRLLGLMFVYTVLGGLAGVLFPRLDFPSLLELVVHVPSDNFLSFLLHPWVNTPSEFLGYEQPRPTAPFSYANDWGNNLGLFLPFFCATWLRRDAGWRRPVGAVVLVASFVPIAYSLNRGLWAGLIVAAVLVALRLAAMGRVRVLQVTVALLMVGAAAFVVSPLYDTVALRVDTPHSNDRRAELSEEVFSKTVALSPLLGYGETRGISGNFASIAGGSTPDCEQCGVPPLGTQGFLWRLIFTTGLLGTLLFLAFVIGQFLRFVRAEDPVALIGCLVIFLALIFSWVYDSLESPLFTMMIAIGLLNRRFLRDGQTARSLSASRA